MRIALTRGTIVIAIIAVVAVAFLPSAAYAASGRSLAVGRAFSYAYNNPMPTASGLSAPMYAGGSYSVPSGVSVGNTSSYAGGAGSPMSSAVQARQLYTPMAPVTFGSSGAVPTVASYSGTYSNPVRDMDSVLGEKKKDDNPLFTERLKSLAPTEEGNYRNVMLRGEMLFRQGKYSLAAKSFEAARTLSNDSPESLLSLSHAYFAMGSDSYKQSAQYLVKCLNVFPDLPMVRIAFKGFFGSPAEYSKAMAALESYVKDHPKDADTLLLLGYLQCRQGQLDKAVDTLEAASNAEPSKEVDKGISAMLDAITMVGQVVMANAPQLDKATNYPWAGISACMPKGFTPVPLNSLNQVAVGTVRGEDKADTQQITLYAYPISDDRMTLKTFMDTLTDSMRQLPQMKDMTTDADAEVPFQNGDNAMVRLFTYSYGANGSKTVMGWVAFMRGGANGKGQRIAYMLGVAMNKQQEKKLLPTLAGIAKSVSLSAPASPPPATIDIKGPMIEDRQRNFAFCQPTGWASKPTDRGCELGQTDFALGYIVSPRVEVMAQAIPGSYTAKTFGQEALKRKSSDKSVERKILSQGPSSLGGKDGYQFVVEQTPANGSTQAPSIVIARGICIDRPDGKKTLYALVLNCRDASAKDAQVLMDKLAATFKLLK